MLEELHGHCQQVADLLGAKALITHAFPDNRLDTVPLLDVIKVVERILTRLQPEVIYTHHGGDLNVDHRVVHQAVLTATRPSPGHSVQAVYAFEVPSSTDWAFGQFEPPFRPNTFVNIADTLELKIRAMSHYETEARAFPHPRSPEGLEAAARRWGSVAGCPAAEAFELIRAVR
jgi:LmbE family N-acetylglucosaminyl deacetylase